MNTQTELTKIGKNYIGKTAQSTVLTMISNCGQKSIPEPPQKINGYEVVPSFGEYDLMLMLGTDLVYESTLFNIN